MVLPAQEGAAITKTAQQLTSHMRGAAVSLQCVIYVRSDRRHPSRPKLGLPQDKNSCFVASSMIALSSMIVLWDQLKFAAKDYEALLG